MASVQLVNVNKVYDGGVHAVHDFSIDIQDKEFIVFVGPSGCGKSTTLRMIAGLEEISYGDLIIDGKVMNSAAPKDRDIAMVFSSSSLYPALNVFDNLSFGLKIRKAPQALIEQRVKAVAEILGITDILYRKPKALTAGQKQRVAIGRAIVREPRLYLFDEPLSGLDDKLKGEMLNVIINMQARMEGTFVYATRNVSEAMTIGTRIAVLKNGLLQQIDSPENLYDYPANAYVAFYIGAPSINFLNKSVLESEGGDVYAVCGQLKLKLPDSIITRLKHAEEYKNTGKPVIVGIRPEDVRVAEEGIDCTVSKTENDNDNYYAECAVCGHDLVVGANENTKAGDKAKLSIDLGRLYLFDGETRLTLLKRDGGYRQSDYPEAEFEPLAFKDEEAVTEKFKPKKEAKKKR